MSFYFNSRVCDLNDGYEFKCFVQPSQDGGATERAVWMHLSERRTELFREVKRMYHGHSPVLEDAWALSGPFWGRHYVFWAGEVPLCVIYEVFSPALER